MLRKRYSLLLWDEKFFIYIHISVKSNLFKALISFTLSMFIFRFPDWCIEESGLLKSSTVIVLGAMCTLSFSKVSFMNESGLAFGA